VLRNRSERVLLVELALGRTAEMRYQQQASSAGKRFLDPGERGADAGVIAELAVTDRSRSDILRIGMAGGGPRNGATSRP
jgi:hypothetical protein